MSQPYPSVAPTVPPSAKPVIGSIEIIAYGWAPGEYEINLLLPPEAQPGQPTALQAQAKFQQLLASALADAIQELGGP